MKTHINSFFEGPMAKQAIIVPVLIMLIFSVFTLTAPMDPEKTAQAVTLGIVNQDEGLPMPPVKVSERMLQGLGGQMPFATQSFDNRDDAIAALEAGDLECSSRFSYRFFGQGVQGRAGAVRDRDIARRDRRGVPDGAAVGANAASRDVRRSRLASPRDEEGSMPTGDAGGGGCDLGR